jgi:hypothetical protein
MTSLQGKFIDPRPHPYLDYYGKPTHREMLMRFDFQQPGQIMEPRWSENYPGRRPLGIAPSGKFAIYIISWVPATMRRYEVAAALRPWVPPADDFLLNFEDRYHWGRPKVSLALPILELEPEFVVASAELYVPNR